MRERNPVILTFTCFYLPGYKGGGPIRTIANTAEILGDEFNFKIITLDRDLGSELPYPGIEPGVWHQVGKAQVLYLKPGQMTFGNVRRLINETPHDTLYLNSCFSPAYTIIPLLLRRLGLISPPVTIVAPRGEFSPGALNIKRLKKLLYLRFSTYLGFYRDVFWQASSRHEKEDILRVFAGLAKAGKHSVPENRIQVALDLADRAPRKIVRQGTKVPGELRVLFLSRISPKKNLDGALMMLAGVKGRIKLSVYGPIEDKGYWQQCCDITKTLPKNIQVQYQGTCSHEEVPAIFSCQDLFFFPTHGENYGHVIMESLASGCPVLISDQTPWRELEAAGVGWDIPLPQTEAFSAILQHCVDMGDQAMRALSQQAAAYAVDKANDDESVQQNRILLKIRTKEA